MEAPQILSKNNEKKNSATESLLNLSLVEKINDQSSRIHDMQSILGFTLNMPNTPSNSGARKILYECQAAQRIELLNAENPLLQTGFETMIGQQSSSFIRLEDDYNVIAKISKFKNAPDHNYYLIIQNRTTGEYDYIERIVYNHSTENFGFLYNNEYMDKVKPGYIIPKGVVIKKSNSFDEYNNKRDGVNLTTTYMAMEETKEDGILISDYAAEAFAAPLIKTFDITLNENDMPINLYGTSKFYKCCPDIGDKVSNGLFMASRTEKNDEVLYAQSIERLQKLMMSDNKYTVEGEVVDITVYCNNLKFLENNYNYSQIKFYNDQQTVFIKNFVEVIDNYIDKSKMSFQLQKIYYEFKGILEGKPFLKEKPFSNVMVRVTVVDRNPAKVGDKITNRYGGKGVIGEIRPRKLMPKVLIGNKEEYVDIVYNSCTCVNRENPGQLFEVSINNVGNNIVDRICNEKNMISFEESMNMYLDFVKIVAPKMYKYTYEKIKANPLGSFADILESIKKEQGIIISQDPMTEVMTVDKLVELYRRFDFIEQSKVIVPQVNSMGKIRYIYARRRMIAAKQYFYRLEQYAEEKFSATSLATTNIRNENSRNNAKKYHKTNHSRTPIKFFGEMETMDLFHTGVENVIINLMLYSASPHGRRLSEKLLTGDPFNIDIRLDDQAKNRSVEKLNVYLRTMGVRLRFERVKKKKKVIMTRDLAIMTRGKENEKRVIMQRIPKNKKLQIMKRY